MYFLHYLEWQNYIQQFRKLSTPNMDYVLLCSTCCVHRQGKRGERKALWSANSKSAIHIQIVWTSFLEVKLENKLG